MNSDSLRAYCLTKPFTDESLPFGPDALVFKVKNKMFALHGLEREPAAVNLKCDPERATELRAEFPDHVLPGYHMNKKHWNTVLLEGLPHGLLRELIDHSFDLVVASLKKSDREDVGLALED